MPFNYVMLTIEYLRLKWGQCRGLLLVNWDNEDEITNLYVHIIQCVHMYIHTNIRTLKGFTILFVRVAFSSNSIRQTYGV